MGKRHKARELAIQVLFHMEFNPGSYEKAFLLISENFESSENVKEFAEKLVLGMSENRDRIDMFITESSKNWRLERMSFVDKSILRLAVYEMLFLDDIPLKVSIDEAVELGKKYGTENSSSFINGVLDHIFNRLNTEENILKKIS